LTAFGKVFRKILSRSDEMNPEKIIDPSRTPTGNFKPSEWTRHGRSILRRYDRPENIDMAIELFKKAVERDPKFAPAYSGLAECYYRKNSLIPDSQWSRLALESSRKAVELDGDLAMARVARGIVLLQSPREGDAGPELDRALELDPRSSTAHMWMAEHLSRKGEPELAEQHFRLAVELDRTDWNPHLYFGVFLMKAARYDHAVTEWEKARQLCGDNVIVLSRLAAAYLKLDRSEDAAAVLQRALEVQPSATTYNNLATLRFAQGRYSDAAAAFTKAIEMVPTGHLYWGNLGDARRWIPSENHRAFDAYRNAIRIARESLSAKPNDAQLLGYMALYSVKSGENKLALDYIHRLELVAHRTPDSFFKSCVTYEIAGDRPKALRDLKAALQLGYLLKDVQNEPELVAIRTDPAYHELISKTESAAGHT